MVLFEAREAHVMGRDKHARAAGKQEVELSKAVQLALACAQAVQARLDGFRSTPTDPPLGIHSAIAAGGKLHSPSTFPLPATATLWPPAATWVQFSLM